MPRDLSGLSGVGAIYAQVGEVKMIQIGFIWRCSLSEQYSQQALTTRSRVVLLARGAGGLCGNQHEASVNHLGFIAPVQNLRQSGEKPLAEKEKVMNHKLLIGMGVLMLLGVASAKSATVAKPALVPTAVHHMTAKPAVHRVSTHKRTKQAARTHRIHKVRAKKTK